jgi:hypothetical protein
VCFQKRLNSDSGRTRVGLSKDVVEILQASRVTFEAEAAGQLPIREAFVVSSRDQFPFSVEGLCTSIGTGY